MNLEQILRRLDTEVAHGDYSIAIKFNRLERKFSERDRLLLLYSDITYKNKNFNWEATVPVVNIPYRDPSLGFLVDGVIFSSVGVYSRAPGIVIDTEKKVVGNLQIEEPTVTIVTAKSAAMSIGYKRNAVHVSFKRGDTVRKVPVGIFLKALSGLPYKEILKQFAFAPQPLLYGFPCKIPKGNADMSKAVIYGIDDTLEPTYEECVNSVFNAISSHVKDSKTDKYMPHWKVNRINNMLNNMHFKVPSKYEQTISVASRAVGTYLDEDICVPYFEQTEVVSERMTRTGKVEQVKKIKEEIKEFKVPKGHYITEEDSKNFRRYDIETLRVRTSRSFVLQEKSPMVFRAKGYKLINDIPELSASAGDIIDDDLLDRLNASPIYYLEVYTPKGRKVLHRSGVNVEVGDFYSILNYLFTYSFTKGHNTEISQYDISNRVILDYSKQVELEVEQTYNDIISSIMGSEELTNLLSSIPTLPTNRLAGYLRNTDNKEVAQSDITNIMSRAISDSKSSALMKETPSEMMAVQVGQYGRLDSFHAPESDKVGSVQQMTIVARLDPDTGEIETPYEKVANGTPTGEIVYIGAIAERGKYIAAWDDCLTDAMVMVRYNGDITTIARDKVDYRDVSPFCDMSVSRMCIPFPGFSQPKRALMATKMNGQAIQLLKPERPLVSTGADTIVPGLYYTARDILKYNNVNPIEGQKLVIINHTWSKNLVEYQMIYGKRELWYSIPFTATDKESLYSYKINLKPNNSYDLDDIVFYNHCCDLSKYKYWTRIKQGTMPLYSDYTKPAMALGVNLTICFKTYKSSTIDDAILISDRLVSDSVLTNIQIEKYSYQLSQNEAFEELSWGPKMHSFLETGEPVITVSKRKSSGNITTKSVYCRQPGEVVYSELDRTDRKAEVWVATYHNASPGDKVAGRFGDKSVIARIIPEHMMPYIPETGETMDVVASPLGMPSRMNYGRILEVALGAAMRKRGEHAIVTPFFPNIKEEIQRFCESEDIHPQYLFNPVYGKLTERPVMVGVLHIMKLEQMSNLKLRCVGYPRSVDPVFGQPVDSINENKGQAIGEMESWALGAAGANKILNSLYSLYSDDEELRRSYFKALDSCEDNQQSPWCENFLEASKHSINKNALATQVVLRMFGCDIDVEDNKYRIRPLYLDSIPSRSSLEAFLHGIENSQNSEWFTVPLSCPVINPFWVYNFPLKKVLGVKTLRPLIDGTAYLDTFMLQDRSNCIVPVDNISEHSKSQMVTGIDAVIALVKNTSIDDVLERLKNELGIDLESAENDIIVSEENNSEDEEDIGDDLYKVLPELNLTGNNLYRFLLQMKNDGRDLKDLIWYDMPIMPAIFRQDNIVNDREHEHSFQTQLKAICSSCTTSQDIFNNLKRLIGYGVEKKDNLISIRGYFFGKGSQTRNHGRIRSSVLSKRIGFSGRAVIIPMNDINVSPFFIGLPWRLVMKEMGYILGGRLKKHVATISQDILTNTSIPIESILNLSSDEWRNIAESLGEFSPYILRKILGECISDEDLYFVYYYLRRMVKIWVEGQVSKDGLVKYNGQWVDPATLPEKVTIDCAVAQVGRQPTLHKKSIRSFFVKLVEGYSIQIHPLVCNAYNADFDGDTMWNSILLGECKNEACNTISIMQDIISEKDGSYTLSLEQDSVLGLYCATTFKDNAKTFQGTKGQFYYFDDVTNLREQVIYGDVKFYEAVVYYDRSSGLKYCTTAGRMLVNLLIPDALLKAPFKDEYDICKSVLGEEYIGEFNALRYDCVWTATDIQPVVDGYKYAKVSKVLLEVYKLYGARVSIVTAQSLFEVGLEASDVYSVSMTMDDMSSTVDKSQFMEEPKAAVNTLNNLYHLGLVTGESRKLATVRAWDSAKKNAQREILKELHRNSNTYYMMYSGARGKPDQVMQSVGFIGNISKTKEEDIEYPILKGYGEGLSSFDLAQTVFSARIGVVSTQAGTRETGYATRQSVYMTSGFNIKEEDCGIMMSLMQVKYDEVLVKQEDGTLAPIDSLLGEFVSTEVSYNRDLSIVLASTGYLINNRVLSVIKDSNLTKLTLLDREVDLVYKVSDSWRKKVVNRLNSYALPFTDDGKFTNETVDWIEKYGLREVIAFLGRGSIPDLEAYLSVDYDTSRYIINIDGKEYDKETLYGLKIAASSESFYYYKNLLEEDSGLTERAINYLTKKKIKTVNLIDGRIIKFKYKLSDLFKDVVKGRVSGGLPYLDDLSCITQDTLDCIEEYQLEAIPVRTGLTCLSRKGVCQKCYGRSLSSEGFYPVGYNIGIATSQTMCEPLSQATLDVSHSGGKRGSGTGLLSGLDYYKQMLRGYLYNDKTGWKAEQFASCSGYISQNKHNKSFVQIIPEDKDKEPLVLNLYDPERLVVPDGAYVDKGDTIISGLANLNRYMSTDIFDSALKTRYLLIKTYNNIFDALSVSARNTEVMSRAQTSVCYAINGNVSTTTRDTSEEAKDPTGNYILRVSLQPEVVCNFTGVASYGFENVANMILKELFTDTGLPLESILGNLITGTEVGSTEAKFIAKEGELQDKKVRKSKLRHAIDNLLSDERSGVVTYTPNLSEDKEALLNRSSADEILQLLGASEDDSPIFSNDDEDITQVSMEPLQLPESTESEDVPEEAEELVITLDDIVEPEEEVSGESSNYGDNINMMDF